MSSAEEKKNEKGNLKKLVEKQQLQLNQHENSVRLW